ncbi:serine hydrolase [Sphingomonas sp. RB3P16]|uniref:serine hydrolase domain-containing protein n=1 Tax=Parasphingomonas frigoris TaxID=3096163 RepID=UPI002FC9D903
MPFVTRKSSSVAQDLSRRRLVTGLAASAASAGAAAFLYPTRSPATPRQSARAVVDKPATFRDGLIEAPPSDVGLDAAELRKVLETIHDGTANIHSVLVLRRGKLVAELYSAGSDRSIYSLWPSHVNFGTTNRHDMRSISKSVVSLLYGKLLERREIPGIDTPVVSLFPEYPDLAIPSKRLIKIRHLLTMTAGLEWNEPSPVHRATSSDESGLVTRTSAYRYVFGREVLAVPGQSFVYSGGATAVLAEIMTRATKRTLRDIAGRELFAPLGIVDWEWVGNLFDIPLAAAGLRLKPRDLLKIGAMLLSKGRWQDRQIVPAAWVAQSTARSVAAEPIGGYGFQWWSTSTRWRGKDLPVTSAIGNGGQRLFLVPDLDMAIVTTAGDYNDPAIARPLDDLLRRLVATASA